MSRYLDRTEAAYLARKKEIEARPALPAGWKWGNDFLYLEKHGKLWRAFADFVEKNGDEIRNIMDENELVILRAQDETKTADQMRAKTHEQELHRIFARKCEAVLASEWSARNFFGRNHRQGYAPADFTVAAVFGGKPVAMMSFCAKRRNNVIDANARDEVELLRFANETGTSVIGGASKLLKFAVKKNPQWRKIWSFADTVRNRGELYAILGFHDLGETVGVPKYYDPASGKFKNIMSLGGKMSVNDVLLFRVSKNKQFVKDLTK